MREPGRSVAGNSTVVVVGCSHRTAPVEVRERFALTPEQTVQRLRDMHAHPGIEEAVILCTCNRVEYYAVTRDPAGAHAALKSLMCAGVDQEDADLQRCLFAHAQPDSLEHLGAVAASLDSMVLGEAEILGQVKQAYELAVQTGTVGKYLHALFQHAQSVAKTIRTVTGIAQHPVSVSSVAVDLAKRVLGDLSGSSVLVLGAGEMAELCLKYLRAGGVRELFIANRTLARAEAMAHAWSGQAVPFDRYEEQLTQVDIVLCSTAAMQPVLLYDRMRRVMADRYGQPLFLIDIAVPRDVEPTVNELDNLYLFDIDGLQEIAGINQALREAEVERCLDLIREEMAEYQRWQQTVHVEPTIKDVAEKIRQVGREELLRAKHKLRDPEDERVLEQLMNRLIGKFLNFEIRHIRAGASQLDADEHLEVTRRAYDLEEIDP